MLATNTITNSADRLRDCLLNLETPLRAVQTPGGFDFVCHEDTISEDREVLAWVPSVTIGQFGDPGFLRDYGVRAAYYAGAMANAIASTQMVIALGKAGLMGAYGAGGVSPRPD